MRNKSLTIVLPVHNREPQLRSDVEAVLELSSELTDCFSVIIVDDGSTDDTFECASELAARYPQISVTRMARRRGLGPALNAIRRRIQSDIVIVHDGVSKLQADEVRLLWQQIANGTASTAANSATNKSAIDELAELGQLHAAMERAHERITGFQLFPTLGGGGKKHALRCADDNQSTDREIENRQRIRSDRVGGIPLLPQPKLVDVVTRFALGE